MQDAVLEELDREEAIAGIQRGIEAMESGRTRPVKEFLDELREEFGFAESRPTHDDERKNTPETPVDS